MVHSSCRECEKRACYGIEERQPTHCKSHAKEGMRNVVSKRCEEPGCDLIPTYGTYDGIATHCKTHMKHGMYDVKSSRCEEEDCRTKATFGLEKGKATHCKRHREDGMYDVFNRQCLEADCNVQPTFGKETGKATHCKKHAEAGMKNVNEKRSCQEDGCTKRPTFGTTFKKPTHCKAHIEEGMHNVVDIPCKHDGCHTLPTYGTEDGKAIYCKEHMEEGMRDVRNPRCKVCNITRIKGTKYRGHCLVCFMNTFPDEPVARNYKVKERHVTNHLMLIISSHKTLNQLLNDPATKPVYDKKIQGGCSSKRGDVVIDCLTHVIVIECDENQHKASSCEDKRIMTLFQDMGNRPMVVIRFNPDKYKRADGRKMPSCFTYNEKGICRLEHIDDWESRLDRLDEALTCHVKTIPEQELTIVKLFYDGYSA